MNRDVLMILANEVKPFLELSRGPHRDDVLSVEKQLAMTLYSQRSGVYSYDC